MLALMCRHLPPRELELKPNLLCKVGVPGSLALDVLHPPKLAHIDASQRSILSWLFDKQQHHSTEFTFGHGCHRFLMLSMAESTNSWQKTSSGAATTLATRCLTAVPFNVVAIRVSIELACCIAYHEEAGPAVPQEPWRMDNVCLVV